MRLKIAIVLIITGACLAWVLWGIDFSQVGDAIGQADFRWVLPVFGVYLVNNCIRAVRLRLLLDRPDISFKEMFTVTTIGFLAINVIPLRMGEFVRPYLLLERDQVPFGTSLAAIFLERLCDLLSLMTMLLLVGWLVDLPDQGIVVGEIDVFAAGQKVVGTAIGCGLLLLVGLLIIGKPLITFLVRLVPVEALKVRVEKLLVTFHTGLVGLVRRPGAALAVIAVTAWLWTNIVIATWSVMNGFEGVPARWDSALTVWTVTITGMTVAPTPGFWGAYEAFCSAAVMLWGVDREVATAFAVTLHLTQFLFIVCLGGSFLLLTGLSLRNVVEASRKTASED